MRVMIFDHMEECTEAEVQRMLPLVSAQRREQALKYKHTLGQFCCLKSWLMLYDLLDERMKGLMDEWIYNEHGKPYWKEGKFFNISHCKEGIAVVVADEKVGIDIEGIRRADKELIERVMNENEKRIIASGKTREESDRLFTRLWTQKEAVVKAIGTGIISFEQLQTLLTDQQSRFNIQTIEKENYIYSIAYGKLHRIGAEISATDV